MKTIGLLSDTHSCWDDRYARHFAGCDEIWHAGDIGDISIIERLEQIAPSFVLSPEISTVRRSVGNVRKCSGSR